MNPKTIEKLEQPVAMLKRRKVTIATAKPRPAGSHFSVAVKSAWTGGWQAEFSVGVQTFAVGPEYDTFSEAQWVSDRLREALTSIAKSEPAQRSESVDLLTNRKTESIIADRDYHITGYVLTSKSGKESCVVDRAAARWLTSAEWGELMHPTEDTQ